MMNSPFPSLNRSVPKRLNMTNRMSQMCLAVLCAALLATSCGGESPNIGSSRSSPVPAGEMAEVGNTKVSMKIVGRSGGTTGDVKVVIEITNGKDRTFSFLNDFDLQLETASGQSVSPSTSCYGVNNAIETTKLSITPGNSFTGTVCFKSPDGLSGTPVLRAASNHFTKEATYFLVKQG